MPYPSEHSVRVLGPNRFEPESFRRKNLKSGIDIIVGKLKGETTMTTQAYRFNVKQFTAAQARKWLTDNKIKFIEFEPASGEKTDSGVRRYDQIGRIGKIEFTPQGFLKTSGFFTRTGIFVYRNADGTERRELRLPEEVFKKDTIESLKSMPLTNDHPPEFVNPDNFNAYSVGYTGERIDRKKQGDEEYTDGDIIISQKQAMDDAQKGKDQLSVGYQVDLEFGPGTYKGQPYDAIQRNIKGNHLAICDSARGGPSLRLRFDQNDAIMVQNSGTNPLPTEQKMKITLDGQEYEVADSVGNAINAELKKHTDATEKLNAKIDDLKKKGEKYDELETEKKKLDTEIADLKKKLDSAEPDEKVQAKLDDKDAEIKKLKARNDELEKKETQRKLDSIIERAKKLLPEDHSFEKKDAITVMREAVAQNCDSDVSEKNDVYIEARFDLLCENTDADTELGGTIIKNRKDGSIDEAEKKRKDAETEKADNWKKPIDG